ncbi:MAG TPA: hypothetical protein VD932_02745 [Aquabacterium sp.]|nr:hypothetical protein [Aquabacterium sp.]
MITVTHHPLSWYADKIARGEPYSSLLYGDGEFHVMSRQRIGQHFTQYEELVTASLAAELCDSLRNPDANIVRGTDPNMIHYADYQGRDKASIVSVGRAVRAIVDDLCPDGAEFVDGVVWDTAAKTGNLSPFLRVLRSKAVLLVGCQALAPFASQMGWAMVTVPDRNAAADLDRLETEVAQKAEVTLVCMGLGAIPLIMRLRRRHMEGTYLDLGSTFDLFVGIGAERGWRHELYADPAEHRRIIEANLAGVL